MTKSTEARYVIVKWESYDDPSRRNGISQIGHRIVRRFKTKPYKCIAYFPMHQLSLARRVLKELEKGNI